jgi:K+-sensing histidine kinase KdpD
MKIKDTKSNTIANSEIKNNSKFFRSKTSWVTSAGENRAFFSNISHNIRNPLSALFGYTELLINDSDNLQECEKLHYLNQIKKRANITNEYLEKFFEWLSINTDKYKVNYQYLNLLNVVKTAFQNAADKHSYIGEVKINVDCNLQIFADRESLSKIFYYIIENAIIFSSKTEVITINAEQKNKYITVEIADKGVGISEEIMNILFDKNQNLSLYHNSAHEGTGLSLIIVKELLEINKGALIIESQIDEGTKVKMKFPCTSFS